MSTKRVVVTGYQPWAHAAENPTLDVLSHLRGRNFDDIEMITVEVPVETDKITPLVEETLDKHEPDVWISLGLYPGASVVAVERLAANVRDFPVPDNVGEQPYDEPVFAEGPAAYEATIPIKAIVKEINDLGVPAKVSNTASTYLCNQIMYSALHLVEQKDMETKSGFIHVPCSPAYVAKADYPEHEYPSMSVDLMCRAVETAVETAAHRDDEIKAPPKGY